ncbi:uncharacterized protein YpmB [Chryseobacterium sediminis]|uniref:Uncharacterized protein YpmB n=1 Tax=Chryseobacterium sediminis TaxID=1679494 RepID=A0ABR6PV77_9FLAO|nr:hypothetical protein [Chryseobacterium sediminis]MBB6329591.1 uncharacterized protein YpmB [Chryseobacterium sediminis]
MNKKLLILITIVAIIFFYFYYGGNYMDNRDRKNFNQFNKMSINDTILDLKEYARGVKLYFKNGEIVFYPKTSTLNENNIFLFTAKKGDKVLKKAFKDTLTLEKKDGVILKYTFMKPK